uniref:Uncharacterized protein n=1 Tax=Salix viminalis TaxID=40686 RepID=A0A6N2N204_SALVM
MAIEVRSAPKHWDLASYGRTVVTDTANTARDRTAVGAQLTWDSAQLQKDRTAGFLHPLEHA